MAGKTKTIPWTITLAAVEFGVDADTVRRKLSLAKQQPDGKGKFTTKQIADGLYGSVHAGRVELLTQQAEEKKLKNAERSGRMISVEAAMEVAGRAAQAIRSRIMASGLAKDEKKKLLADINGLKNTSFADAEKQAEMEDAPELVLS